MRILILGGTLFLGRHLVVAAQAREHELTLFNRGTTGPGLFPEVEQVHGDRDGGLGSLGGRRFDAVIDTCGYLPRVVEQSAAQLASRADFYLFVSSLSVYARFAAGDDESAPLSELSDSAAEDVQAYYGPLKAACEQTVQRHFAGRAQYARAGFIVGPYDRIDRFPYWVQRLSAGGPTLAPGAWDNPMQWIDVRDLAQWLVRSVEQRSAGAFDLTGPASACTVGEFLDTMNAVIGGRATLIWPGNEALERVGAGSDGLPYWAPSRAQNLCRRRIDRALQAGLLLRPLEDTTRDTRAQIERDGFNSDNAIGVQIRKAISRAREAELLAGLRAAAEAGASSGSAGVRMEESSSTRTPH